MSRPSLHTSAPRLPSRDWQAEGLCRTVDAELFFPPFDVESTAARIERESHAKAVCAQCPVRRECLDWALAANEPYGVWGGYSESERRELHLARQAAS